jgi:hypothetical protein
VIRLQEIRAAYHLGLLQRFMLYREDFIRKLRMKETAWRASDTLKQFGLEQNFFSLMNHAYCEFFGFLNASSFLWLLLVFCRNYFECEGMDLSFDCSRPTIWYWIEKSFKRVGLWFFVSLQWLLLRVDEFQLDCVMCNEWWTRWCVIENGFANAFSSCDGNISLFAHEQLCSWSSTTSDNNLQPNNNFLLLQHDLFVSSNLSNLSLQIWTAFWGGGEPCRLA